MCLHMGYFPDWPLCMKLVNVPWCVNSAVDSAVKVSECVLNCSVQLGPPSLGPLCCRQKYPECPESGLTLKCLVLIVY